MKSMSVATRYQQVEPQTGHWVEPYKEFGNYNLDPEGNKTIQRVDAHFQSGGSDKVYLFTLTQDDNNFYAEAFYGRRYAYLSRVKLYTGTSEVEARKALDKQILSKKKKGYEVKGEYGGEASRISNVAKYDERVVWPMGAQPLKEGKKKDEIIDSNDWIAEEKIDGVRLTAHITPNGLKFFSRSAGKDDPDRPIERTYAFSHLAGIAFPEKYVGTVIDVEAHAAGMTHEEISGHINATDGRDTSFIYFKAFDLIQQGAVDLVNLEWKFRRMKLTQLLEELAMVFGGANVNKTNYPFVDINNIFDGGLFRLSRYTINDKVDFHNNIVIAGGEGTMWKNINAKYKEGGKPANTWYKWKKEDTADVVIVGFTDAKPGKYAGMIGAVRYAEYLTEEEILALGIKKKHTSHMFKDGKDYYLVEIGQCSGMTDAQRQDFTDNQMQYLNQVMEVEYMERTKKGALLHPRFVMIRTDKTAEECIYSNQSGN